MKCATGANKPADFAKNLSKAHQLPASLEMLYEDIINRLPESSRQLSLKIFPWLAVAARQIHSSELKFAIAMDGMAENYQDTVRNMIGESELKSLCPGLIGVGNDGYVQFVHSSIQGFFLCPTTNV